MCANCVEDCGSIVNGVLYLCGSGCHDVDDNPPREEE